jgi:RsiW-degrading membrane proteinase PrsW (M82 family)
MQVLSYQVLAENGGLSQYLGGAVDTATIAAGISAFAPVVVAWITKKQASDRVKAIINLLAVAVASVIALVWNGTNDGSPITWQLVASTFMAGLVASIVAYKGVWKPLQVTPAIANASANFGVGTPVPAVIETARPGNGGSDK